MEKVKIGIIGCGTISAVYLTNFRDHIKNVEVVAVADRIADKAIQTAERFNVPIACSSDDLLQMPEIQIVLNLTIPAVHYSINKQILEAGKHVYCEKPLAVKTEEAIELVKLAEEKGLMCMSAPDTFLGAGIQECRSLLDSGRIGKPFGFTANLYSPGHEIWHPNPGFFYQEGGGPLFDMGPYYLTALVYLLGPVKQLCCFTTIGRSTRNILGEMKETEIPTTYVGMLEFECGAVGNIYMSLDTWDASLPDFEIYGTEGTIYGSDPNMFHGAVHLYEGKDLMGMLDSIQDPFPARLFAFASRRKEFIKEAELTFPHSENPVENMRGLGVSDMAQSIMNDRPARLSPYIALHVVEIMNSLVESAKTRQIITLKTTCERTAAMDPSWDLWEVK